MTVVGQSQRREIIKTLMYCFQKKQIKIPEKKMIFFKNNKRGFTLLEILVVVAIIAIIASIFLVASNLFRTRAKRNSALSTVRSMVPEIRTCADERGHMGVLNSNLGGGYICVNAPNGNTALSGHSAAYPTLPQSWTYTTPTTISAPTNSTITSSTPSQIVVVTGDGETVTCTVPDFNCTY